LILVLVALGGGWVINEFASKNWLVAISGLNPAT
jgi:short-chain fatty acids transporter